MMCRWFKAKHLAKPAFNYDAVRGPTSIIEVRGAMKALADDMEAGIINNSAPRILRQLAEATHRRPPISVAPRKLHELSDDAKAAIRQYHRDFPDASQLEIAKLFDTNPGRVSEALNEGRA